MDSGVDTEVVFNTGDQEEDQTTETRTPPIPITQCDMDIIIRGWEAKFTKIAECLREVQLTSERASSDMCLVGQEARAQSHEHDRRLAEFLRKFENIDALRASTPRRYPDFGYQTSPVGREEVSHPHSTLPHTRSARTDDPDSMETQMGSARCRTSRVRAQKKKRMLENRATRCRTPVVRARGNKYRSGTRARGILEIRATRCRTPVVRAQGNTCCSGTRTPGIKTTISGTRATESRTTLGTRAPYNFVLMIDLHTMTTNGIAQRHTATHRFHARHRVQPQRERQCAHTENFTKTNALRGGEVLDVREERSLRF